MLKKLLFLLLLLPLTGSAKMYPLTLPIPAVCWNSLEEAMSFHNNLGERVIGRGTIPSNKGFSGIIHLVDPLKPSWTVLHVHKNRETGNVMACVIVSGTTWEIFIPDYTEDKIEL